MSWTERINDRLSFIYKSKINDSQRKKIIDLIERNIPQQPIPKKDKWQENDIILITYGDSLLADNEKPLNTLSKFMNEKLHGIINTVHILPFFPFSSDDGFSVIDFNQVNPALGDWDDVEKIAAQNKLMVDLVINHASSKGEWFYNYKKNEGLGVGFFIEENPNTDLSKVVRPRNLPLLTPVETAKGPKHVWTTFSDDQIDLNFENPEVLYTMLEVLFLYINKGAQIIRLDAIAFLWKELGTTCLHLPETHEVVKLMRDAMETINPNTIIITETNVPNKENLSYFGSNDEAHMVYQFSLPPLLLHALNSGNGQYLNNWASGLPDLPDDCTYFNFTSSHDGIGVRPLEGLLPDDEKQPLFEDIKKAGGLISMKANSDGTSSPYELNITYYDALKRSKQGEDGLQDIRFLCSQIIMLAMKGIPALYIHSLLASKNNINGVKETGRSRTINRERLNYNNLIEELNQDNDRSQVVNKLLSIIALRTKQTAFHPSAFQKIVQIDHQFFCILRKAKDGTKLLSISNLTHTDQSLTLKEKFNEFNFDLIEKVKQNYQNLSLKPYQTLWLVKE